MLPIQHPVIVLPGTYFSDLVALVTFMYSGEVNIFENQLAGLLSVAETLQIRGLAEFTWSGNLTNNEAGKKEVLSSPRCKRAKTSATVVVPTSGGVEEITVSPPLPQVPRTRQKVGEPRVEDSGWGEGMPAADQHTAEDLSNRTIMATDGTTDNNQLDSPNLSMDVATNPTDLTQAVVETKTRNSSCNPKMYATCFVCGKQLSNQYNLRVHMETHQNAHYACSACNHVSRSRDALRKHVSYRHPQTTPGLQPPTTPRSTQP
ncbi:hypothetical protein J6590_051567 [Homalodisca vitripennis]|nr:hypothetical protein J6590_051567 [Homalodisca vitripennis]